MQYKIFIAVVVSLANLFLLGALSSSGSQAAKPSQNEAAFNFIPGRIQIAQSTPSSSMPPTPEKPYPHTGVQGRMMTRGFKDIYQGDPKVGAEFYKSLKCASCHGKDGKGQGPAAKAMKLMASDWTDKAAMEKLTDDFLNEIIANGGKAVNKSNRMPAYSKKLKPAEVTDLVAYVRSFGK
ncbi:MAG: c-type cytochrome [Candidatus Binatia bacterium]